MFNEKWQLCNDKGDRFVFGADGFIYLESFLKNNHPEETGKIQYRTYVYLTKEEYDRLLGRYGQTVLNTLISSLDEYLGALRGKRYKYVNHCLTLQWFARKWWIKKQDPLKKKAQSYDIWLTDEQKEENKAKVWDLKQQLFAKLAGKM